MAYLYGGSKISRTNNSSNSNNSNNNNSNFGGSNLAGSPDMGTCAAKGAITVATAARGNGQQPRNSWLEKNSENVLPSPFSFLNPHSRASPTEGGAARSAHSVGRVRTGAPREGEGKRRKKVRTAVMEEVPRPSMVEVVDVVK